MECAHICVHAYVCVICSWVEHNCTLFIFFYIHILPNVCTTVYVLVFLLMDIWVFPHFGSYKLCCCEHSSTYLLSIHTHTTLLYMPRVEVLDQRVWIYPVLMDNNKILYPLVQIFLPHNCWSLPCLPLLSSSFFSSSFKFC